MVDVELITETRGGYDEWSDSYQQVVEVRIDNKVFTRFPDNDVFTTEDGRALRVEFPARAHDDCSIEIHEPTFVGWEVSVNTLEDALVDATTIDIEELGAAEYGQANEAY